MHQHQKLIEIGRRDHTLNNVCDDLALVLHSLPATDVADAALEMFRRFVIVSD